MNECHDMEFMHQSLMRVFYIGWYCHYELKLILSFTVYVKIHAVHEHCK